MKKTAISSYAVLTVAGAKFKKKNVGEKSANNYDTKQPTVCFERVVSFGNEQIIND